MNFYFVYYNSFYNEIQFNRTKIHVMLNNHALLKIQLREFSKYFDVEIVKIDYKSSTGGFTNYSLGWYGLQVPRPTLPTAGNCRRYTKCPAEKR